MSLESQTVPGPRSSAIRASDRAWDLFAVLLLSGGVLLFALGRASLGSLAHGTYDAPTQGSWVSAAEHHDAQTRWGAWLIGAGLVAGTAAAGRHVLARRRPAR